jgi:hypothetical protein
MFFDLAIVYDPNKRLCDLALGDDGDLLIDETPITPMLLSIGLDRRAAPDDPLPDGRSQFLAPVSFSERRGCPGDALDLPAGSTVTLICTGTTWALAGIAYSEVPSVGDVTIYVRTDGSDSNDGSSNDSGHALATIGEALNRAKKAGSSNTVTIQLGVAGTYAERIVTANIAATIVVKGDTANQANYNIAPPGTIFSVLDINNANVSFQGIRLVPSGTVTHELYASSNATVSISNVTLSAAGTISGGLITAATGATITISAGCNILAGAGSALNVNGGTIAINENVAVGTPTYTAAFVAAANGGAVLRASTGPTFSGSATGTRYAASMNSIISTNGGGANYFPGTVAGSVSTGGQYA